MSARLPALSALRAFESAARHLSFQAAAEELAITPSAVSHQIRSLEAELGPLFVRHARAVSLTERGAALAPGLSDGFAGIARAVAAAREVGRRPVLTLSTGPAIAAKWIVPRLYTFEEAHPEIDMRIATSLRLVDLVHEGVDVGIRFGRGDYAGLEGRRLFGDAMAPLCSPAIAETLRAPVDMLRHRLMIDASTSDRSVLPGWAEWFDAAGVPAVDYAGPVSAARSIAQAHHTLQAAMDGAGIALGRVAIGASDLAAGRLVRPFALQLPTAHSFWLVTAKGRLGEPPIRALLEWLGEEIERQVAWLPE